MGSACTIAPNKRIRNKAKRSILIISTFLDMTHFADSTKLSVISSMFISPQLGF